MRTGRTALEMPSHSLAPLQAPVIASTTGPCAGLCQLQAELDTPTHESGSFVQPRLMAGDVKKSKHKHKLGVLI